MKIGTEEWKAFLIRGASEMGVSIEKRQADRFAVHAAELMTWNRKMNLTAITDPIEMAVKHYLDSIAAYRLIPESGRILDVGTGGGFPGIPLKILIPKLQLTLIDSTLKKIHFLKHIIRTLKLEKTDAIQTRVETLSGQNRFSNGFDRVVSRALFPLIDLVDMSAPLIAEHGKIVAWKGEPDPEEIESLQSELNEKGFAVTLEHYTLPCLEIKRSLVIFGR